MRTLPSCSLCPRVTHPPNYSRNKTKQRSRNDFFYGRVVRAHAAQRIKNALQGRTGSDGLAFSFKINFKTVWQGWGKNPLAYLIKHRIRSTVNSRVPLVTWFEKRVRLRERETHGIKDSTRKGKPKLIRGTRRMTI